MRMLGLLVALLLLAGCTGSPTPSLSLSCQIVTDWPSIVALARTNPGAALRRVEQWKAATGAQGADESVVSGLDAAVVWLNGLVATPSSADAAGLFRFAQQDMERAVC